MDFVEGLPLSHGYSVIMVIMDRFNKYNHFLPMTHPYTIAGVARIFMDNIFKLHGLPQSIINDIDPIFISNF